MSGIQFVDHSGTLDRGKVQELVDREGLAKAGTDYTVIGIFGPQSSGKSTLLNNVFQTSFQVMNAESGRTQTTQGIWLARAPNMKKPVVVMDVEGSDSRERGEDDESFEKKSALLALCVCTVVMINMWTHDVGRMHGAGTPLLKTIFQAHLKLFKPKIDESKKRLLFILRDRTKTPLDKLQAVLLEDLQKIWGSLAKPPGYENSEVSQFFDIDFTCMSSFESAEADFRSEAKTLREQFDMLAADNKEDGKLPGSALPLHLSKLWETISSDKDLSLPAQRILVATIRCEEIAAAARNWVLESGTFRKLSASKNDYVADFGAQSRQLVDEALKGYDQESLLFDQSVRTSKRDDLVRNLRQDLAPLIKGQLRILEETVAKNYSFALETATAKIKEESKIRSDLFTSFNPPSYSTIAEEKHADMVAEFKKKAAQLVLNPSAKEEADLITDVLAGLHTRMTTAAARHQDDLKKHLVSAVRSAGQTTFLTPAMNGVLDATDMSVERCWGQIRDISSEYQHGGKRFLMKGLAAIGLTKDDINAEIDVFSKDVQVNVRNILNEASRGAVSKMKERFLAKFSLDENGMPRQWGPTIDIPAVARAAKVSASDILSILAIARDSDGVSGQLTADGSKPDSITRSVRLLADPLLAVTEEDAASTLNLAELREWPKSVVSNDSAVILKPENLRRLWAQFSADVTAIIGQAQAAQQAAAIAGQQRALPMWVIVLLIVLGWNEIMALISSPIKLILVVLIGLFAYTLYKELKVDEEMQRGALPAFISLSSKFVPAVQKVSSNVIDSVMSVVTGTSEAPAPEAQQAGRGRTDDKKRK